MVLSKRYSFWSLFACLSIASAFLSYKYMDTVYSFVNVAITVDRQQILMQAKEVADELDWDISDYQDVTSFDSEDDLQCFVELEAGGKDAFVKMFQSGAYYPYHWHVRFFKEKQVVEMHAWFSPQGKKLGFFEKVSELTVGAALTQEQARILIEQRIENWCSNFQSYKLIEYNCEKRQTGRIDHDFTYERSDCVIGEGFYRFHAVVCGDRLTKLEPSVKVPDNFIRRYQQMRSANNLLASVGSFFFRSLYILFFGLVGLVLFYRRNYLLYKSAALASLVVTGGMFLRGLNDFPLWWSSYNTVQSVSTFVCMQLFQKLIIFVGLFAMTFLTLVVAEAAGRYIYKDHVQFFKIWSWPALGSYEIFDQLLFGYLIVPLFFLYGLVLSYCMKVYFGWWSPAGSLFDPNIVASYFPWFGALSISLYAGFSEEIICRALPFAMTATLTKNSKYKKFWFILIFVLQAMIFGACHANYPNQPFYARLIELIPLSFGFGWMYLQFGLLPGIITHFVYDVILFSLPIFASNLVWSKILVIFFTSLPLLIVCAVYAFHKRWHDLSAQYFNQAFFATEATPIAIQPRRIGQDIPVLYRRLIFVCGLIGLISWIMTYKFDADTHPLLVTRLQAIEIARQTILDKFGVTLDEKWTAVVLSQDDATSIATKFVWQKYGQEIYDLAQGSYLAGLSWAVRFVQFSGQVEDRGEEYLVVISGSHVDRHLDRQPLSQHAAHVIRAAHKLPEHFSGADIDQEQAEKIAYDFIAVNYNLQRQDLNLISVTSDKLQERRDWTIILQDTQIFDFGSGGQARIKIKISGDILTAFSRFIFVPEDWDRAEQERLMNLSLVKTCLMFLLFALMAVGCLLAIGWLSVSQFGLQILHHKALFITAMSIMYSLNSMIVVIASFVTAEPFYDQLTRVSLGMITNISWQILFCSIFLAAGAVGFIRVKKSNLLQAILIAIAVAFMIVGASSVVNFYQPYLEPVVGNYGSSAHWSPMLACSVGYLKLLYIMLSSIGVMFILLKTVRKLMPHFIVPQLLTCVLFCIALESTQLATSVSWMFAHGLVLGLVIFAAYYLVLQYDMTLLPLVCGSFMVCMIIPELLYPAYCGAQLDALIAIGAVIATSLFFYERAHKE